MGLQAVGEAVDNWASPVKWMMGIIATLITGGFMLWLTAVNTNAAETRRETLQHGHEITALKVEIPELKRRLVNIENKLDELLFRTRPQKETTDG